MWEATPSPHERTEHVLSLGEATARPGVGRFELEAMIAGGKIEVLPTGFTRMMATREIKRPDRSHLI